MVVEEEEEEEAVVVVVAADEGVEEERTEYQPMNAMMGMYRVRTIDG